MSCVSPNYVYVFYDKNKDKRFIKYMFNPDLNKVSDITQIGKLEGSKYDKFNHEVLHGFLEKMSFVPCGSCIGCALEHSKQWSMRMQLEALTSINSYFLTLTYDDEHLPKNYQLVKDDLQSFIKKLKRYFLDNFDYKLIRYYACGEYGSNTGRPHYHLVVYNCPITVDDFKLFFNKKLDNHEHVIQRSLDGTYLFHIDWLDKLWAKGFVSVGSATPQSMAYVARYVNKKKLLTKVEKEALKAKKIQTEFNLMSLKPGIGAAYYLEHYDEILKNDCSIFLNGRSYSVDRYFYKIVERTSSEDFKLLSLIKDKKRDIFNKKLISRVSSFDNDYNKMYKKDFDDLNAKSKLLKRNI